MNKRRRYQAKRKRAARKLAHDRMCASFSTLFNGRDDDSVYEKIELSREDWAKFLGAVEAPPQPNERLKALFRRPGITFVSVHPKHAPFLVD